MEYHFNFIWGMLMGPVEVMATWYVGLIRDDDIIDLNYFPYGDMGCVSNY